MSTSAPMDSQVASARTNGSIGHAKGILLSLSDDVHSLTEIARRCHLSKSTTHRVLKLLERSRLVVEDNLNRRYYLGPLVKKLASDPAATHRRLTDAAIEEMRRLAAGTGETVAMDILVGIQYVPLLEIPSRQDLKVTQESHKIGPPYSGLYAGAALKVLLCQLDDDKMKSILGHISIHPETERTVTDKVVLKAQLDKTRKTGYAVSRGERVPGVMCVSVPVRGYFLPVALNVVGPELRLEPALPQVVADLKLSAGRIAAAIAAK